MTNSYKRSVTFMGAYLWKFSRNEIISIIVNMALLYQDLTIMFPQGPITIRGEFSAALATGLLEGFYFGAFSVADLMENIKERDALLNTRVEFRIFPRTLDGMFARNMPILSREEFLKEFGSNVYILLVYEALPTLTYPDPPPQIFVFNQEMELREFLQGFITVLNAFHINPQYAFLRAPFRGDQDYAIQGLNLPILQ